MPELNDRDLRILEHTLRYRLTTQEFLFRLYFPDTQLNAVTKVTSRLCDTGWLARHDMPRGRTYFVPGGRAAAAFGASSRVTRPFSEQTLPRAYGVLAYCVASGNVRLTEAEFQTHLPQLAVKGLIQSPHVIDRTQTPHRLALLIVDRDNSPERLLLKATDAVRKRARHPQYHEVIQQDRFSVTIVTAAEAKRVAIQKVVARREERTVPVDVAVAPELAHVWPERIDRRSRDARLPGEGV